MESVKYEEELTLAIFLYTDKYFRHPWLALPDDFRFACLQRYFDLARDVGLDKGEAWTIIQNRIFGITDADLSLYHQTSNSIKRRQRMSCKRSPFFGPLNQSVPFPSLKSTTFGLAQEQCVNDPFRLLVTVILFNRTRGKYALPVLQGVLEKYSTPNAMAQTDETEVQSSIVKLGLQRVRSQSLIKLTREWVARPPDPSRTYKMLKYGGEWEIAHLPGIGPYALDSWRIFCCDVFRCKAEGWNGEGATIADFQPEWKRVVPRDKELRAFLQWAWLREGFVFDPEGGRTRVASRKERWTFERNRSPPSYDRLG